MEQTDLNPDPPPPETPINLTDIVSADLLPEPGLYFSYPEQKYHQAFALSASGMTYMRASAMDWWARSALNPRLASVLESEGETKSDIYGHALHKLVLEGPEAFAASFVPPPNKADYPDALDTAADMRNLIENLNEGRDKPDRIKKSGTKDELADAILRVAPTTQIWEAIVEKYTQDHAGKEFIKQSLIDEIQLASAMITRDPNLKDIFTNGYPEVTIFYRCQQTGIPCKTRWDYLKVAEIAELKSFANTSLRPIDDAVRREMNQWGYAKQAAWRLDAAAYIPAMIRAGRVFGDVDKSFLDGLLKHKGKRWRFVFSCKGPAPQARARWFSQDLGAYEIAKAKNDQAKHLFAHCLSTFGSAPWVESQETREMTDDEFADWSF